MGKQSQFVPSLGQLNHMYVIVIYVSFSCLMNTYESKPGVNLLCISVTLNCVLLCIDLGISLQSRGSAVPSKLSPILIPGIRKPLSPSGKHGAEKNSRVYAPLCNQYTVPEIQERKCFGGRNIVIKCAIFKRCFATVVQILFFFSHYTCTS